MHLNWVFVNINIVGTTTFVVIIASFAIIAVIIVKFIEAIIAIIIRRCSRINSTSYYWVPKIITINIIAI